MGPCAVYYKRDLFRGTALTRPGSTPGTTTSGPGRRSCASPAGAPRCCRSAPTTCGRCSRLLIQQTGGQVFDDQGRIAINSPQARQALAIIRRMRQAGICSDIPPTSQEWMAGFNDDSIATYPGAVWLAGTIKDTVGDYAGKKADWGVFRLPAVAPGGLHVANLGGSVLVIPAQCREQSRRLGLHRVRPLHPRGTARPVPQLEPVPRLPARARDAGDGRAGPVLRRPAHRAGSSPPDVTGSRA